jgi:hypothetical protein
MQASPQLQRSSHEIINDLISAIKGLQEGSAAACRIGGK